MPGLSRKRRGPASPAAPAADLGQRVQRDLEARGVSKALSKPLAARIAGRVAELDDDAYTVFLDGCVAAQGAAGQAPVAEAGAAEIQRLVRDFAIELKKLDEGLKLLSAYLVRIRDRTGRDSRRIVH